MSEILNEFIIQPTEALFTVEPTNLIVSPDAIQLNVYTGAAPVAGGSNTNVQFNEDGVLQGSNSFTFNNVSETVTIGNLAIGNVANLGGTANVKISGGNNTYFLQTDGTGNLSWAPGTGNITGNGTAAGANTQIQFTDGTGNFQAAAGFTFDNSSNVMNVPGNLIAAGEVTATYFNGNIDNANLANYAGYVVNGNQSNITAVGTLANLTVAGTIAGNIINTTGDITSNANITANGNITTTNITGTLLTNSQPNITTVGTLGNLDVTGYGNFGSNVSVGGTTSIYEAIENVQLIGAQTGTYNFDMLDGSIQYSTANATANLTLNFRGNIATTANTMLANGKSITSTYLMTTGANAYSITGAQIDGSSATIKWVNGVIPVGVSNCVTAYTFTIVKTSTSPTYAIFASGTRYV